MALNPHANNSIAISYILCRTEDFIFSLILFLRKMVSRLSAHCHKSDSMKCTLPPMGTPTPENVTYSSRSACCMRDRNGGTHAAKISYDFFLDGIQSKLSQKCLT